jgi:hypothetical protein
MKTRELPPRLNFKNGGYYHVERNIWNFLGRDKEIALNEYRSIEGLRAKRLNLVTSGNYDKLYRRTKMNAVAREIPFLLEPHQFSDLVAEARGKCQLTGIRFDTSSIEGAYRKPFAPSLDRINSSGVYERGNVRLVCCAVNAALSDWGVVVFERLVTAYYWHHRRRLRAPPKAQTL